MAALLRKKTEDAGSLSKGTPVLDCQPIPAVSGLRNQHAEYMLAIANERCRTSFSELFAFYAPRVKSFMLRLGADNAEAEELAQEVMVTVWRKAGLYDPAQASVSTWIFRVARNRRIDAQRRKNRPQLSPDDPMLQPAGVEEPDITCLLYTSPSPRDRG
jgi:RNA polymerase sigma-70 factor (ECF subfamily)